MPVILLTLIFTRPFISSLAFPYLNFIYSALLFAVAFIWLVIKKPALKLIKPAEYPLILFILTLLVSVIFSRDKITSANELYKYLSAVLLFIISASFSEEERNKIIFYIVVAATTISLLAIYQYFFGFRNVLNYLSRENIGKEPNEFLYDYINGRRVFFPFVTPNILGGYLAMVIPLTLTQKYRLWLIVPLCCALLLTKSLGALLSIFLGLAIYLYLKGNPSKRNIIFLAGLLIIIVGVLISRQVMQKSHTQPVFSAIMRFNYWRDTLGIIKAHFWTGVGLGNFNLIQSRYAHNSYLQIWAESGISGIVSILWLIIIVFKGSLKNLRNTAHNTQIVALITANAVFLIHNFIDFTFFLPEISLIWWIILGLTLGLPRTIPKEI